MSVSASDDGVDATRLDRVAQLIDEGGAVAAERYTLPA